ncbi:GPI anchored cell wall protein [Penicillium coprophilum]|uniref:GPI anchored cell wall protein n=1 Tax=Penicillium coprophilum TaxID=36646 RepID=UPI0023846B8C|nr:GPI anchored cell wall protein [Penicillium coprophilum]KAJ5158824.1 GPI anchored cell wall protein [Penicillium coprophilum]
MMKNIITIAAFAAGTNALVGRSDSCCFHLTSSGDASGKLGQLSDGQNRIGDDSLSPAQYCIDSKGAITDANGRGCILTPPTTQFQCDEGASPTPGFSLGPNGELEYHGGKDFVACATGQNGGLNVYTTPNESDVTGCVNVKLTADSCSNSGSGSGSGSSSSASAVPSSFGSSSAQSTPSSPASSVPVAQSTPASSAPVSESTTAPSSSSPGSGSGSGSSAPAPSGSASAPSAPEESPLSGSPITVVNTITVTDCSCSATAPVGGGDSGSQSVPSATGPAPSGNGGEGSSQPAPSAPAPSAPAPSGSQPSESATGPAPSGGGSQPSGSSSATVPASSVSATPSATESSSGSCPTTLTSGNYEYPHLIVPVDSSSPDTAAGTSYNGTVSSTISSVFNFDIPSSDSGKTCSLVFLFPELQDLETSSYSFSGDGKIDFSKLSSAVDESTTFKNLPSVSQDLGDITVSPGNSYVVSTFSCPAGEKVTYKMENSGSTDLNFFEDYNPSPYVSFSDLSAWKSANSFSSLGLYITTC